jgi:hypothetical protein
LDNRRTCHPTHVPHRLTGATGHALERELAMGLGDAVHHEDVSELRIHLQSPVLGEWLVDMSIGSAGLSSMRAGGTSESGHTLI